MNKHLSTVGWRAVITTGGSAVLAFGTLAGFSAPSALAGPSRTVWVTNARLQNPPVANLHKGQFDVINQGDGTGSVSLVTGPGASPNGVGSLQLQTAASGSHWSVYTDDYAGLPLRDVTALSYTTYTDDGGPSQDPALQVVVDPGTPASTAPTGCTTSHYATLNFEPYLQPAGIVDGTWQTWDALSATGVVWAHRLSDCAPAAYNGISWNTFLSYYPDAVILPLSSGGGVGINVGSGWTAMTGNVATLTVGADSAATTYDFAPHPGKPAPGSHGHGGPGAQGGHGYDSIPTPPAASLPSVGAEAHAFNEFGNEVTLAGSAPISKVTVTMDSWACQSGSWDVSGSCTSAKGSTFTEPITLNLYNLPAAGSDEPGGLLASVTQTFTLPYRPSSNTAQCPDGQTWYDPAAKTCYHGVAANIVFHLPPALQLPSTVVYGISYNTSHYGPNPDGETASCYTASGGCPYDSLNIGLSQDPTDVSVGSDVNPGTVWQNSPNGSEYCDGGAAGTGTFRLDSPGPGQNCWSAGAGGAPYYVPAVHFE